MLAVQRSAINHTFGKLWQQSNEKIHLAQRAMLCMAMCTMNGS